MTDKTVCKLVMSEVLSGLIRIVVFHLWRIEQPQCIVCRLVPTIARVVEYRHTILAGRVCQVSPLMGINLKKIIAVVTALYTAKANIVGGFSIADAQREFRLQQCVQRAPVYFVFKVYPRSLATLVKMNALSDFRLSVSLLDDESLAQGACLYAHFYAVVYWYGNLVERGFLYLPSRPYTRQAVIKHNQTQILACGNQFATCRFVIQ